MKRCPTCGAGIQKTQVTEKLEVAGHAFIAMLPALKCRACDHGFVAAETLQRFELAAAVALADAGEASPDAMRFMRKSLGLKATELAALLGVTAETISRWETGNQALERRALGLVGALVKEHATGGTLVRETLEALRHPRKLKRRVELSVPAFAPRS